MAHKLTVTLVRAEDLPPSDFGIFKAPKSDPYFTFKVGGVRHKSSVVKSNLNPVWTPSETFSFAIDEPKERVLEIECFDHDTFNKDDLLATRNLPLAVFLDRKTPEVLSYDLELAEEFQGKKYRSVVFLEIQLNSTYNADVVLEVWENERFHVLKKWTSETFLPTDRRRWSAVNDSSVSSESLQEIAPPVPEGMTGDGWAYDASQGDANGWIYATSFQGPWQKQSSALAMVRRRKWVNKCHRDPTNQSFSA